MQSYKLFEKVRREQNEALGVLDLLGKRSRSTAEHIGTLHNLKVSATVHYQAVDGAANYHNNPALDAALSKAAREMWPQLRENAELIMAEAVRDAQKACRSDLEQALEEIKALP